MMKSKPGQTDELRVGRITALIHRAVARPRVYDAVQTAGGAAYTDMRVRKAIARSVTLAPGMTVIDVGGGTGRSRLLWPSNVRYVLIDNDHEKIAGFEAKRVEGEAVYADAKALPFADATVDVAMLSAVIHHLPPGVPEVALGEIQRVLKPDGRLILHDAVWRRWRPVGRVMWRFDRGSYPRGKAEITAIVDAHFKILSFEEYSIFHRYVLLAARPRP